MMNLAHQEKGVSIASNFSRLMALDEIWTGYLAQTSSVEAHDIPHLRSIVTEMDRLLGFLDTDIKWLFSIAPTYESEYEASVESEIARSKLTPNDKMRLRKKLLADEPRQHRSEALAIKVQDRIAYSRDELAKKIRIIESGKYSPGDLSEGDKCLLSIALVLGGYWCPPLIGGGAAGIVSHCF
jgi:hypothetical protein